MKLEVSSNLLSKTDTTPEEAEEEPMQKIRENVKMIQLSIVNYTIFEI